ncbi:phospholipase/carboxylesterase [Natronobacillus azotifigens]|uniref:Alpha/beta hydrolase n=1 Tax=Natronobacillus azotifigens TaxID=472978 RepID=A0A9J6R811_9BACI|nr:alpha/beta hydrolase [Natronobacillus azotifigens]MCZ0701765.1 alpha/beta hydrolase [Natronobacillus azotifigens]
MKHIFQAGKKEHPTLLLLHGTGGSEKDLLSLAEVIDPNASVLSVRGNVLENGMSRFFRRLEEGVFDEEDLINRTVELNDFLTEAAKEYNFDRDNVIAIGYSNGANIAGSLLFHHEDSLRAAILHHPMVPRRNVDIPNLAEVKVFIGAGINDPLCSAQETKELATILTDHHAEVSVHWEENGHQLTQTEVEAAAEWYRTLS